MARVTTLSERSAGTRISSQKYLCRHGRQSSARSLRASTAVSRPLNPQSVFWRDPRAMVSQPCGCGAGGTPGCTPVEGNRHFWDSDYHVHRRGGWMASVRMYSTRTIAARCVNNQGKRNSHEADGVTNLYLTSDGSNYPCTQTHRTRLCRPSACADRSRTPALSRAFRREYFSCV